MLPSPTGMESRGTPAPPAASASVHGSSKAPSLYSEVEATLTSKPSTSSDVAVVLIEGSIKEQTTPKQDPVPKRGTRLGILWTVFIVSLLLCSGYIFRDYVQRLLTFVEDQVTKLSFGRSKFYAKRFQNDFMVFFILVLLYFLVSLPFVWGYIVINLATGYLYGFLQGLVVTVVTATIGIYFADAFSKRFLAKIIKRYSRV